MPLKQFQCLSDWQWPFLIIWTAHHVRNCTQLLVKLSMCILNLWEKKLQRKKSRQTIPWGPSSSWVRASSWWRYPWKQTTGIEVSFSKVHNLTVSWLWVLRHVIHIGLTVYDANSINRDFKQCMESVWGVGIAQWLVPDLWSKGCGFESLLERWENFLLQGQLSVLTLILVSIPPPPPPCYRSSM